MIVRYRVILVVSELGCVDSDEMFPRLVGSYCSYLLPKRNSLHKDKYLIFADVTFEQPLTYLDFSLQPINEMHRKD